MVTRHAAFTPIHGTPKTIELLSTLGPMYSRLSVFPDSDHQSTAQKYFDSDNPNVFATDLSNDMRGFP